MDIKINKHTVVVFDLDDTLYNEIEFLKSAYRHIAKKMDTENWKPLYSVMLSLYRSEQNVFNFLVKKYSVDIKVLIEMYRNHIPDIELFDGVLEVMNSIKSNNGQLAIITDGRVKTQSAKLKALGIENLFDKIIISETLGTEKPNEANYKAIETSLIGSEYYYIADNLKKDFVTPNILGWATIGLIDNGLNIHSNSHQHCTEAYMPDDFILSYKELKIT
ncbi:HAD family hydrolase [Winogradskyella sp.]|uniref:HAD family hydrolase n=1 Tax=Winogradskyella sp. TaxID=1883156 RepID=UPI0025DB6004|nr:HAD family hydrolase [Winogradskyella sp.]